MPNSKECKSEYLTQLKLHKIEKCIDNPEIETTGTRNQDATGQGGRKRGCRLE